MPVQTFKTRDEVPAEQIEKAVEAKDGTFYLFVEEDTGGLKSALEKERKAAREAAKREKEIADKLAAIEAERQEADLAKAGLKDVKRKWQAEELEPVVKERDAFREKYLGRALAGEIKAILADLDVVDVDAAYRLLGSDFELGEEEKPVLKADPTADVKAHLEKQLGDRYKYLVRGTQAAGDGARGPKGSAKGGSPKPPTQWTAQERREFIERHGASEFQRLLDAEGLAKLTAKRAA
jgi:hypothetical protein